ncbi:hypothetical protein [Lentilactobacillus senioris]|uniref:hypothetical protein n=1 Tax=Lentilactobacillus senioris TaxID=931534 RepID=UPI003D2964BA
MRPGSKKHIEEILMDYPKTDGYIKRREEELTYPFNSNPDENIGGGHPQNNISEGTAMLAMTLATDRELQAIKYNKLVVDNCLSNVDLETRKIINVMYFNRHHAKVRETAFIVNLSESQVSRKRSYFFKLMAKELGFQLY